MLQSEMSRLFDTFFEGGEGGPFQNQGLATTTPKVDVSETSDAIHVTA
jgi:HSP20 family molecular chaperone IbpA